MKIENTILIDAPVRDIWNLTIDVEALPELTPTMTKVSRIGHEPIGVGSEVSIKQPGQPERVWTVIELEPDRSFVWSTKAMGMTMTASHQLADAEVGTSNTLTIEVTGALSPVVGPLLRRPLRKALATENQGFKAAAEH